MKLKINRSWLKGALLLPLILMSESAFAVTGTYVLGSKLAGRIVEVSNASTADGAQVTEWRYNASSHQQWIFTDLGNGYHKIVNANSGKALARSANNVIQTTYTGADTQEWVVTSLGDGWYKINCRNGGQSLDIPGQNPNDGTNVGMYNYNGGNNQQFFLVSPAAWNTGSLNVAPGGDIQAAIDQVGSSGGGTVNLGPGTHTLNATLKMRTNIVLKGSGISSTILSGPNSTYTFSLIEGVANGLLNITVRDFTLEGLNGGNSGIGIGAAANFEHENTTLLNLYIRNVKNNGIGSSGHKGFTWINVTCDNNGNSGYLHNAYCRRLVNLTISRCVFINSVGGSGLKLTGGSNWLIQDCVSTGNVFDGITIQDNPDAVTIKNSIFNDNGRGTNIGATNMNISHCTFNNNAGSGLWTTGGYGSISNCTATDNGGTPMQIHGGFTWQGVYGNSVGTLNGRYELRPAHGGPVGGKCVEVISNSTANGANVQQWSYTGGNSQKWDLTNLGGTNFQVVNANSGKAMEVAEASMTDGANVQQGTSDGSAHQQWIIVGIGNGQYSLTAVHSGKRLDVAAKSGANGANVHQWSDNGGSNQKFYLFRR